MLIFGVLFLLGTTGIWPEFSLMKYWPLVFVALGLHKMFCRCKSGCNCEMCMTGDKGEHMHMMKK